MDTGPGEIEENNLFLALDGIDTGIALNESGSGTDTLTVSGTPNNQGEIVNALKDDRQLAATIVGGSQNAVQATFEDGEQTTLTIEGKRRP